MARGFLSKDNLTKDTLLRLAEIGIFTVAAATSPYFLHRVIKQYFKEKGGELAQKRARKLKELQKRKLVDFREVADGSVKITLSHLGKNLIRQYKLEDMRIKKPKHWDKQWRIIIYDVPVYQNKARDAFRQKIKNLGLYPLQKSIWVTPRECLSEIEFLCGVFEINMDNNIYYFKASEIPKEKEVKKFFHL